MIFKKKLKENKLIITSEREAELAEQVIDIMDRSTPFGVTSEIPDDDQSYTIEVGEVYLKHNVYKPNDENLKSELEKAISGEIYWQLIETLLNAQDVKHEIDVGPDFFINNVNPETSEKVYSKLFPYDYVIANTVGIVALQCFPDRRFVSKNEDSVNYADDIMFKYVGNLKKDDTRTDLFCSPLIDHERTNDDIISFIPFNKNDIIYQFGKVKATARHEYDKDTGEKNEVVELYIPFNIYIRKTNLTN